ncbi:diiron oxygenase [Antrihabitans sp. YC3-6]|uniref:Diiron oxygenase n=2 Tax=Antrihabitans stalagmiti TaxID=2799499 RepID=A0A934U1V7_9NOCA|nr:diiron oxygenase [Antrihabitans stalagmiti]
MTLSIPSRPTRTEMPPAPYVERASDPEYLARIQTLSAGSVHRSFDPYRDIDWDSPEFAIDAGDPRWILSPISDPLGAHPWYQALSEERRIAIGFARQANVTKVGLFFESVLIRGLVQTAMRMPNGSTEFRYCMHEITEECNHIQMFQELINRMGVDVPGMRWLYRRTSPVWPLIGAAMPVAFLYGILAGEEPIDHYQKDLIREGRSVPPALLRTMEIHIAEEARHISFAYEFVRARVPDKDPISRALLSLWVPFIMRFLAGAIMVPPRPFARELGIPSHVIREAFWRNPASREILAGYFGDVRMLTEELGLMNPVARFAWRVLHIDGPAARYRGEPKRRDW